MPVSKSQHLIQKVIQFSSDEDPTSDGYFELRINYTHDLMNNSADVHLLPTVNISGQGLVTGTVYIPFDSVEAAEAAVSSIPPEYAEAVCPAYRKYVIETDRLSSNVSGSNVSIKQKTVAPGTPEDSLSSEIKTMQKASEAAEDFYRQVLLLVKPVKMKDD